MLGVIVKTFLQMFVQKSGVGESSRSVSHFVLGNVMEEFEEVIIL